MAQERTQPLQDTFLKHLQENDVPVTMFLINGIKLQGYVTRFDNYGIALTRDHHSQFIYKQAISTIMPLTPIQLYTGRNEIET